MNNSSASRSKPLVYVTGVFIILTGLLAGCSTPEQSNTPKNSSTTSAKASATPTQSDSGTPTSTALEPLIGLPVGIECEQVMSTRALYDYNPNFAFIADRSAPSGSISEQLKNLQGVTCSYENLSGGTTVDLAVAKLAPQSVKTLSSQLAQRSTSVTNFGNSDTTHGFFSSVNGVGIAQVINGDYWIVAESSWFSSASEATDFISAAVKATQ